MVAIAGAVLGEDLLGDVAVAGVVDFFDFDDAVIGVVGEDLIFHAFEVGVRLEEVLVGVAGGVEFPRFGGGFGGGDEFEILVDDSVREGAGGDGNNAAVAPGDVIEIGVRDIL